MYSEPVRARMFISPEIPNRNSTILRNPRVNSARFRRFSGVSSLGLAICLGRSVGDVLLAKRRKRTRGPLPAYPVALAGHVRVVQGVMARDLDREVRAGVAVDISRDDREVAVSA